MKGSNVYLLPTAKTEVHSEFEELAPLIREKVMDLIFARVESEDSDTKKKYRVLELLRSLIPKKHKYLLTELEDIILAIECKRIEKATLYVLENGEQLKRTVLGF